jgi:hypothetical protein
VLQTFRELVTSMSLELKRNLVGFQVAGEDRDVTISFLAIGAD